MMQQETKIERQFWRYWLGGLLLLAVMIAVNPWLSSGAAPWGIRDHQSAATALRVNDIQQAWQATGVLGLARFSIALDLLFIAVYSFGAFRGGQMMRYTGHPVLRRLGTVIMVAAALYPVLDYAETVCQFIQVVNFEGDDILASIAATAQPVKSVDFLVTFLGLLIALFIRRRTARAA